MLFLKQLNGKSGRTTFQKKNLGSYFEGIGIPFVAVADRFWYSTRSGIFVPLMSCGPIRVTAYEKKRLWNSGARYLRYPVAFSNVAFPLRVFSVSDKTYDLTTLTPKARKQTETGLRKCSVERIPVRDVLNCAPSIIADTYSREGMQFNNIVLKEWMDRFGVADQNPLFECWASLVGSKIRAFRLDFNYMDGFYSEALFGAKEMIENGVMSAMMFVSTREFLRRPEISHVSYSSRGFYQDRPQSCELRVSMGYNKIRLSETFEVSPRPLVKRK